MPGKISTRQLAAIMFTDIVGYTALMGKDEKKAFHLLQKNREIQKPIIEEFHGKFIKELGDGIMASFNTASDAVYAAIKIQDACTMANEFRLRIGIHLGEVVFENDDVFGDGVNIASRIQGLCLPGAIFISETVNHNVVNKNDIKTRFVKEEKLKNVKEPVRIYEVLTPASRPFSRRFSEKIPFIKIMKLTLIILALITAGYFSRNIFKAKHSSPQQVEMEKSIAILPFEDLSPGKDQEYLSDGVTQEIIHSITAINGLKVIGTNSTASLHAKNIAAREIGEKLGVGVVLDGSIQKSGNILRITAHLINVKDNRTIWSQRFDKEMKDIFAKNIVEKLQITLTEAEKPRLVKKATSQEVYTLFLKAMYTYKQQEFAKSIEYNREALKLDSTFAPSWAWMALAQTWKINRTKNGFTDYSGIRETKDFANRAIQLDSNVAESYSALALMAWAVELDFATAKIHFEKSVKLNPSASLIRNRYGYFLLWMGDFKKALQMAKEAIQSDPLDINGYIIAAQAYMYMREFVKAENYAIEGNKLFPGHVGFKNFSYQHAFLSGNYNKVEQMARLDTATNYSDDILGFLCLVKYKKGEKQESNLLMRRLQLLPVQQGNSINYWLARIYTQRQQIDSAFNYLERSLELRESGFRVYKIDPILQPLRVNPRYKELYHQYGFHRYQ